MVDASSSPSTHTAPRGIPTPRPPAAGTPALASDDRARVVRAVASRVADPRTLGRPVLVAVDGVDGAGKSWFAGELADVLRGRGHAVVHASVDGFHRPRAERYRRGRDSAQGYWLDAFDYDALRTSLLEPLAPGGSRRIRRAVRDVTTDRTLEAPREAVGDDTVLVLDGVFLQREELTPWWDLAVFLDVAFTETYARMARRDGCPADPADPANRRYLDAQRHYLTVRAPRDRADVVVDNTDLAHPVLVRG